jgi:RNA polymerase sporulation-specific sigma factor
LFFALNINENLRPKLSKFAAAEHRIYNLGGLYGFGQSFFAFEKPDNIFFVSEKSSFPKPLSKEKEHEYILRAEAGDKESKEILIRHNLRLVAHIAKKYANYGDNDELISIGSIGLIKAIDSYKLSKGTQLATYASRCIENEILMTMRVSKKYRNNVSLSEPLGVDRDGNELTLIDMLAENGSVIEDVESNILMERLLEITKRVLSEREYSIICMRYGLGGQPALTQREVAAKFDISRSYVSRIEKHALNKIKESISKEELYF